MKISTILMMLLMGSALAQPDRNIAHYNLNSAGEGLIHFVNNKAYDPVGYFSEGGASAQLGLTEYALDFKGVRYLFANGANMKQFLNEPQKYEPTYGGWCARAMVAGSKVAINTDYFTLSGKRLHFFVNARA